jgi:phosphoenolpyruvate synthase/pyruvate phosphate dikinase
VVNRTGTLAAAHMVAAAVARDPCSSAMSQRVLNALRSAEAADPDILRLDDERAADPALAGGKAASLSRHAAAGHRVPSGFVVALPDATLDRRARAAVVAAYRALGERCGAADPPVAVRSSAVDEDGAAASFAGQHDTFLNVSGADQVWWAIARCVASFGSDRARAYRRRAGLAEAPERAAVLVQWLVAADAAGVVFSANPVTGARDEVVVNAAFGLGESVVAGTVTPDTVVIGRDDLAVRAHAIADKRRMTIAAPGGVQEVAVPGRLARTPAINGAQARAAAALAIDLERATGGPVDLEVAWSGSGLFLVQCRPITTLNSHRSPM